MMAALHAVNKILFPMSHFVYSWNMWLHYKTKCCHGTLVKAVQYVAVVFLSLSFLLSANKNDKNENKTGEPKKPKTTGEKLRKRTLSKNTPE